MVSPGVSALFSTKAFNGSVGPSFQWNILNYGRIQNNVRLQNFKFQELIADYQSTVLNAAQDVENGLVQFLKGQEQTRFQNDSVVEADRAVKIALLQYKAGTIDFTRALRRSSKPAWCWSRTFAWRPGHPRVDRDRPRASLSGFGRRLADSAQRLPGPAVGRGPYATPRASPLTGPSAADERAAFSAKVGWSTEDPCPGRQAVGEPSPPNRGTDGAGHTR